MSSLFFLAESLSGIVNLQTAFNGSLAASVLADLSEISRYGRSYVQNQNYTLVLSVLAGFGLFFLALHWASTLLTRKSEQKSKPVEKSLLSQIAQALKLTPAEEQLISQMAEKHQIQPPEVLLIDPSLWSLCLNSAPQEQTQLLSIAEKLFGEERCQFLLKS